MGFACTCHAAGSYSGLGAEAEPGDWATAAAAIAWTWPSGGAGRGLKVLCMDVAAAAAAWAPGVLQGARLPMVHASWGGPMPCVMQRQLRCCLLYQLCLHHTAWRGCLLAGHPKVGTSVGVPLLTSVCCVGRQGGGFSRQC